MNTNHKNNFYKYLYKMNQITEYIAEINTRDYKNQCKYLKKKLFSLSSYDINRIIFFKTLHVIFNNIPHYLSKLNIEINEKKRLCCNFWDELHDDRWYHNNKIN